MLVFSPELFDDESLYSWLARWGLRSGMPSNRVALKHLIGDGYRQLTSLLPSYAEPLSRLSHQPVVELIGKHTAIGYFRLFTDISVFEQVVADMVSGDTHSVYARLSIVANRVVEPTDIRFCPICAARDYKYHGVTIWHMEHQLPGVVACAHHRVLLCSMVRTRSRLLLPPQTDKTTHLSIAPLAAVRLAQLSTELLYSNMKALDSGKVAYCYRVRLAEKGYASIGLKVRQDAWRKELENYWLPVLKEPSIKSVFDLGNGLQFPSCMVRGIAAQHHPLKHLLMIGALFNSVSEFANYYQTADAIHKKLNELHKRKPNKSKDLAELDYQQQVLFQLHNGKSLRQVTQTLGGSVTTVKRIALRHGIEINRRAQKLFEAQRCAIRQLLVIGKSTQDIAKAIGCSVGAVEQELGAYPELKELRRKIRFYRKRGEHRTNLLQTIEDLEVPTRKQVQTVARASYTWLFKHDKEWLYEHLPVATNSHGRSQLKVPLTQRK
ncbi:hypothetical protein UB33_11090 [Photobacterium angustum]|uniref:TnsD family Tn7-like transposition protein n=1 Tax=Photobacterium angustum TaxID=661 RepID=UPI0005E8CD92|nr:TnsD family Tn7-like transposition protein [Photobacterium angustum]KJG05904.1 hypothetical protein UB33_11090 [Photobacterium angustum]PSV92604.1 hypothetical protein CTN01_12315 [Photobacterium angustum]